MKKCTLFVAGCLFALFSNVQAQTNLYFDDFESYTAGGKVALQAGAPWTTWSLAPGGTEDPVFSATQAYSGNNSIFIANNHDPVFQLYNKTSGRYACEWYMFVETGKLGYFNFLSVFAGNNSKWAFQAFVKPDSIIIDAAGEGAARKAFPYNTWNRIQMIIDLDDDFATLYVNGTEIISYQWSKGAQGTDNSLSLDGINFYGWSEGGVNSAYYIDDLKIDSVAAPVAPSNLTAVVNGADIDVDWTAPVPAPDLYKLSRNGAIVYAGTNLSYTDVAPWPYTYTYAARAHYAGEGYSHSSNEDSATIAGGVTRNLVLMEVGTGTWCQYCPGAAMGIRDLIEVNHKNAAAIKYHWNDSYEIPASAARLNYYSISSFPTTVADGTLRSAGGSGTQSLYPIYLDMYNQRINFPGHHTIDVNIVQTSADNYTATITVEQTFAAFASGFRLHAALTQSGISHNWYNQTKVDNVCRGMYPDFNGTVLDFSSQNTQTVTLNFSTAGYVKNNCEFIVFVQHAPSKEVTQTAMVDMESIIGLEEMMGRSISLYPNPATEYFILNSGGQGTIEVFNLNGSLLISEAVNSHSLLMDVRSLPKGMYLVRFTGSDAVFTEKLVID